MKVDKSTNATGPLRFHLSSASWMHCRAGDLCSCRPTNIWFTADLRVSQRCWCRVQSTAMWRRAGRLKSTRITAEMFLSLSGPTAPIALRPPQCWDLLITHLDTDTHTVGLLWTSDQLAVEADTYATHKHKTDGHPYPQLQSKIIEFP
jgi:hypothetical protein